MRRLGKTVVELKGMLLFEKSATAGRRGSLRGQASDGVSTLTEGSVHVEVTVAQGALKASWVECNT